MTDKITDAEHPAPIEFIQEDCPRRVTDHKDGLGLNDLIEISADERDQGNGNSSHEYNLRLDGRLVGELHFQHGPRLALGSLPGLTDESILAVAIDRLRGFQSGPYACRENAIALTKIEEALHWLQARAKGRAARGVLGKNEQ